MADPRSRIYGNSPEPTVEQLRDAIDSGRTGDKIPVRDPAAAPLGADEEAAGTPLSADRVEAALATELRATPARSPSSVRGAKLLIGFASAVVVLTVAALAIGA